MDITKRLSETIRDVKDFPVKGVVFKDITPIFKDISLFKEVIDVLSEQVKDKKIDKIVGIESRGFLFGIALAVKMNLPFVTIRKKGKLPAETIAASYQLEYGTATVEIHKDAISAGENVLIVDDLLATGGTVTAASELVKALGGIVAGAVFVIELTFLNGRNNIEDKNIDVLSILKY